MTSTPPRPAIVWWITLAAAGSAVSADVDPTDPRPLESEDEPVRVVTPESDEGPAIATGPTIDVWYGSTQRFGHLGQPQPWVNVLGNVTGPHSVVSLTYQLNGAPPVDVTIGPDGNRLVSDGDFNVDLATNSLLLGANLVEIVAEDAMGSIRADSVVVDYQAGPVWPRTYAVDWSTLTSPEEIQEVAHVVDGDWMLDDGNLRTVVRGYDRLVAMGDLTWDDYEVTVPLTIHSSTPWLGVGILFRWGGHTDNPIVCDQPKCGWLPLGAICWYRLDRLEIYGNHQEILDTQERTLEYGIPYWFKARVETNEIGGLYQFKVWPLDEPEPATWDVIGQEELTDPQQGSMMLLTHRADVSFGPVAITDLTVVGIETLPTDGVGPRWRGPHPNPFSGATTFSFALREPTAISIDIYDVGGRLVRALMNETRSAGVHAILWDGRSGVGQTIGPGVYFYVVSAEGRRTIRKLVRHPQGP